MLLTPSPPHSVLRVGLFCCLADTGCVLLSTSHDASATATYLSTIAITTMSTLTQPSFPPITQLLDQLRATDYRRLALSAWNVFVTACVYTFIAGQLTRRAFNFTAPYLLSFLRAVANLIESSIAADGTPLTTPKLHHPAQQGTAQPTRSTSSRRRGPASRKAAPSPVPHLS
jgi:hypothetical protein